MNKTIFKLVLVTFFFIFISCDKKVVFDEYRDFDGKWKSKEKANFEIVQNDTISKFNMFINIRNNNDYPFNNLYLIVKMHTPKSNQILVDTLEYNMTYPDGTLLGKGFSDVKESKLVYKENYSFPKNGKYIFEIEHALRQNGKVSGIQDLEGVFDVGFRIEKTK